MAAGRREDLRYGARAGRLAEPMDEARRRLLAHSLTIRQVSAGGSAGCELEAAALENVVFDSARFGIQLAASPRHADAILVTGPVTVNMRTALEKTYEAMPVPKVVAAAGAGAISGAPYEGLPEVVGGADTVVPVDLYVPGHPPHPLTILDGVLRLLGRIGRS
jgi:Ni,Fe-hydrogenase III small subunit